MTFPEVFLQLPEKFLTCSWWLYNKDLINQLFVPYGKYSDLSFLYGPHFIRSVLQNCDPNILPSGPHYGLIRAWYLLPNTQSQISVNFVKVLSVFTTFYDGPVIQPSQRTHCGEDLPPLRL